MLKAIVFIGGSVLFAAACGESEGPDDGKAGAAGSSAGTAGAGPDEAGAGGQPPGGSAGSPSGGSASGVSGEGGAPAELVDAPPLALHVSTEDALNCVITTDAALYCWGFGSGLGATGTYEQVSAQNEKTCAIENGGTIDCFMTGPFQDNIPAGSFQEVRVGVHGGCAKNDTGVLTCWDDGQAPNLVADAPTEPVSLFALALDTACALLESGGVTCWGEDAGRPERLTPPSDDYTSIAGRTTMYGIRADGSVEGWGRDFPPIDNFTGDDYVQLAVGAEHACGLHADGTVSCIGPDARSAPAGERFVELSAGDGQTCGIAVDGRVLCWGTDTSESDSPPDTVRAF